jgi:hypothetical protein
MGCPIVKESFSMKAIRVNLTFFYEPEVEEQAIKDRLEKFVASQFPEVKDYDIDWLDDGRPSSARQEEDLAKKLDRLDT